MMGLSLKSMIQSMQVNDGTIHEGTVQNVNPIEISLTGNDRFNISGAMLIVPQAYSDYNIEVEIKRESGGTYKTTGTVHNALQQGDKVALLIFNEMKNFMVIGKM